MTIAPIRDLGSVGVVTDTGPYNSDLRTFSMAVNARFEDNRISRAPVFSTVGGVVLNTSPRYVLSYPQLSGVQQFHIANRDGTVTNWSPGTLGGAATETTISPVAWTPSNYDFPYTHTSLQDMVFLNRADRVPWYKPKNSALFAPLPNVASKGWDPSWRCAALRSVGGVLVALNITKGGIAYPTMVKTSDFMAFGSPPAEWVGSTTNSATENVIADMSEPIIDGWPLRDKLVIYTAHEAWLMEPRYDNLMFSYRRIFTESTSAGVLNQNCITEVNNTHYVFGDDDIWVHDSFKRKSIAAGRVRNFIYSNLDKSKAAFAHVVHNSRLTEIMFCYVSNDPYCRFPNTGLGCNRAAVYNYRADTWTFYDLPYSVGAAFGTPITGTTYTGSSPITYDSISGSYSSFGDDTKRALMFVGLASTGTYGSLNCAVRSFDLPGLTSLNGILDAVATSPVVLETDGIDLDELKVDIRGYKVIKSLYPEGSFQTLGEYLVFAFTARDYSGAPVGDFSPQMSWDGYTNYKLDFTTSGRFIDIRINYTGYGNFGLSGIDVEYDVIGHR